jgi:hypothetical protein
MENTMKILKLTRLVLGAVALCAPFATGSFADAASAFASQVSNGDVADIRFRALSGAPGSNTITDEALGGLVNTTTDITFITGTAKAEIDGLDSTGAVFCTNAQTVKNTTKFVNCGTHPRRVNMTVD